MLERRQDVNGVSGVGRVAEGAVFTDGTAVLRWYGLHPTTAFFECLDDVIRIHGHGGTTCVVFDDLPWTIKTTDSGKEASHEQVA